MSFSVFCPSCANQTAYLKYTFHTLCQQLIFHLLFVPFTKAKIFIPLSRNPKRKARNKQFNSHLLLNASQCAPLTSVYVKHHFRHQRDEGSPRQGAGRDKRARLGRSEHRRRLGLAGCPLGEPDASLGGGLHLTFAMSLPLPYPCFNGH